MCILHIIFLQKKASSLCEDSFAEDISTPLCPKDGVDPRVFFIKLRCAFSMPFCHKEGVDPRKRIIKLRCTFRNELCFTQ